MTRIHAERALVEGRELADVVIEVTDGRITAITPGGSAENADLRLGTVLAGSGNAHSHAFHRALRGRTHDQGGDFWRWREQMYAVADRLTPDSYERLAEAVFAEMLVTGWTTVAEFHYIHHRPDGTPYEDPNAFGTALTRAANAVGIRLTLLDTLYLSSAAGKPLLPEQSRFGDGTAEAWLERWQRLHQTHAVGAAIHSIRAVSPDDIALVAERVPAEVPLHVHVSEQPAENEQSLAAYGRTPVQVLADAGALSPRTWLIHATHLTDADIALIADGGAGVVMCPTTEADLGDGIGPARELADAEVRIALGSDQNAVIDPWLEVRGLEAGERLRSRQRGRFSPADLESARTSSGYAASGLPGGLRIGACADLVELDPGSVRTAGAALDQLALAATASDVRRVVVGGRVVAEDGRLADGRDPAAMFTQALKELG
ncbi:formimidoylglutamate deiminase [Nocardioides albus]|uniref:Formiminoglutamate deiminase n=1 Tax=Nocardioides albus TaxID=1841 RepID=A0A7W5A5N2_9ACTN|nr:formimidoylglutamate deiminase [Nocardioides albus]MBB3090137.1 formiminoglutamate deiminase [Nocardioides albus]GGU27930.1 formimidoylglutamate deiminase [Nocardioides albus]